MNYKRSFSFIEIIAVIAILGIFYGMFIIKLNIDENKLPLITDRLILYLKQTRIQAMIDEKFYLKIENNKVVAEENWHKKRWTLKFLRCDSAKGGLYFAIYSDTNKTGQINKDETLKDPLTNKYIYNNNTCNYSQDTSKYTLLTQEFNIKDVQISCNSTDSLGQLSFGSRGELYSKLSDNAYDNLVTSPCKITLYDKNNNYSAISIEPITGFIQKEES